MVAGSTWQRFGLLTLCGCDDCRYFYDVAHGGHNAAPHWFQVAHPRFTTLTRPNIQVWDSACGNVGYRRFGGTYYLRLQFKSEAISTSESMATTYQTSRCHNPDNHDTKARRTSLISNFKNFKLMSLRRFKRDIAFCNILPYVEICHSPSAELSLKPHFSNADKGLKSRQSPRAILLWWVGGTISMAREQWRGLQLGLV
jgi:hypothetical protein